MKPLISIVIPIYNEELVIPELCKRIIKLANSLTKYSTEIIMVENGSFDNSFKKLLEERKKEKRIKILKLAKNEGTDGGIFAGLTFATGDVAVTMTADLQDTPETIINFLEKWEKGYEIVYGIVTKREKVPLTRKIETFFYYKIIKLITKNMVKENASDFRLLDKKVYKVLLAMPEHEKFFRGLVFWTGFKHIGIPYKRPPRFAGESKAFFSTAMKVALNGLFAFSPLPFFISFFFSVISLAICLVLFIFHQQSNSLLSFFFACLFFVLGVISEYIRRIFVEVQNRPQFIIREKIGF
jgi:glycosyltransferase involved in cell wall biosynthesis